MSEINLTQETDASVWANEFLRIAKEQDWTMNDLDFGLMVAWFANAIMAGYDEGRRAGEALIVDDDLNHGG